MRILLFFVTALISAAIYAKESRTVQVNVSEVLSGDTFRGWYKDREGASHGGTFRLYCIQAPIKDEAKGIEQPYWKECRDQLSNFAGKKVKAVSHEANGNEYWSIFLNDKNINLAMVRTGHAWYQSSHIENHQGMKHAQEEAKKNRLGLWREKEKELAALQNVIDRLLNRYGGKSQLEELARLKVSLSIGNLYFLMSHEARLKVAWDLPKDRVFGSLVLGDSEIFAAGFLVEEFWVRGGGETNVFEYRTDAGKMAPDLDPGSWVLARFFSLCGVLYVMAKLIPDELGEPSTIFDAMMEEPLGKADAPVPKNPLLMIEQQRKTANLYLASGISDIDAVSQTLRIFEVVGDTKSTEIIALHIGEDGALIAIDVHAVFSSKMRIFIEKEAFETHALKPNAALPYYCLVESIEPLSDEDEALFNPPEVNAVGADAKEAE